MDEDAFEIDEAVVMRGDSMDDWYVLETRGYCRISDADVEGDAGEMRGIADAIERRAGFKAKRCAVDVYVAEGFALLWSPRNSTRAAKVPLATAIALAAQIRAELPDVTTPDPAAPAVDEAELERRDAGRISEARDHVERLERETAYLRRIQANLTAAGKHVPYDCRSVVLPVEVAETILARLRAAESARTVADARAALYERVVKRAQTVVNNGGEGAYAGDWTALIHALNELPNG